MTNNCRPGILMALPGQGQANAGVRQNNARACCTARPWCSGLVPLRASAPGTGRTQPCGAANRAAATLLSWPPQSWHGTCIVVCEAPPGASFPLSFADSMQPLPQEGLFFGLRCKTRGVRCGGLAGSAAEHGHRGFLAASIVELGRRGFFAGAAVELGRRAGVACGGATVAALWRTSPAGGLVNRSRHCAIE